jgi:transposase, IS6 family
MGVLVSAVDSAGETIEFMLSPNRDLIAAKLFLRLALSAGAPSPRVINVDGHPAYASAIADLKQTGELGRRCRCRTAPYLNNILEQDHRFIKKRITASLGFDPWRARGERLRGTRRCRPSAKVRSDGWRRAIL